MFQEKMMRQDDDTLFDSFITRVIWANWAPRGHIQVSSISPVRNVSLRDLLPPCHPPLVMKHLGHFPYRRDISWQR